MPKKRQRAGDPRRAVAYARASTGEQGLSTEAQRAAVAAWAQARGVELVAVAEDVGVSGSAPPMERPGFVAALEELRTRGAGLLVVARRDRLARDARLAAVAELAVEATGARVVAVDAPVGDEPEAVLLRGLLDLLAQHERSLIRARTKAAMAVLRSQGRRVGSVPLGAREEEGRLVANAGEIGAAARARQLRAEGASLRKIAAVLTREGFQARGRSWHPQTVKRLLGAGM